MNDAQTSRPLLKWLLLFIGGMMLLCLVMVVGAGAFYAGQATAVTAPEVEILTEQIEVTREVPVAQEVIVTRVVTEEIIITQEVPVTTAPQDKITPSATPQPPAAPATGDNPDGLAASLDLSVLYEAWNLIERDFDGPMPSETEILQAIIGGSLETLNDPYTQYVKPSVAQQMREDLGGSVEGIGAFVRQTEDGLVEIVRPISGQPADLVGLRAGDIIIGVDGESVIGQSMDEVLLKVRGPRGSVVNLTVLRGLEELEFTITRARFEVPIIEASMITDNIGYLRLSEFNSNAEERVRDTLTELTAQGAQSIIFDLRDNPGGFLNQSVAVADLFLPENVVLFERNNQGLEETFWAQTGDEWESIPMVVLVNAGSASASEIVAGALQDHGRSLLIGETTFGKGSVQQLNTLSDGSLLRITFARWYTPNNASISEAGVTPDIIAPTPEDRFTLGGEGDTQLQRAIEYLQSGQ